jgi:hypothetical protein
MMDVCLARRPGRLAARVEQDDVPRGPLGLLNRRRAWTRRGVIDHTLSTHET